uniref:Uncharacterized protein n=1 Tax=Trypanosoma congolense (strain IL3000) TaxID=1068625 RepID=G0URJ6_TRYCI|nr:conserved hypothetical protein [Trypanosoma congolense IL3000]
MFHLTSGCSMLQPSAKYRRGEACVNFQRSRVCPTAVRAYRFMSEDVSSQMDLCSTVLRVPPAGLIGAPPTARGAEEEAHQPLMLITWEDTTPAEIAMSLLDKVRRDVDLTFASTESETNATLEKSDSVNKAEVSEDGMNHGGKSSTAVYIIKLSAGYVGVEGKATLSLITCVELRQVVSGEPYVFPSRRAGMPNVDVPISTLSYRLGDPIFFTCKRLR